MKKYGIYALMGAMTFGVSTITFAQDANRQDGRKHKMYDQISDLTDAQKKELGELNKTYRAEFDKVRKDEGISQEAKKEQMKVLRTAKKEKMAKILTADQMAQMQKMKQEKKAFKKGREMKMHHQKGNFMKDLQLTEAQQTKIDEIHKKTKTQMKEIKMNERAEIEKVLTPEQQAKMKKAFEAKQAQKKEWKKEMKKTK